MKTVKNAVMWEGFEVSLICMHKTRNVKYYYSGTVQWSV